MCQACDPLKSDLLSAPIDRMLFISIDRYDFRHDLDMGRGLVECIQTWVGYWWRISSSKALCWGGDYSSGGDYDKRFW